MTLTYCLTISALFTRQKRTKLPSSHMGKSEESWKSLFLEIIRTDSDGKNASMHCTPFT